MAPKKKDSGGYPSKPDSKGGSAAKAKPAAKAAAPAADKGGSKSKKESKADKAAAAASQKAAKEAMLEDMMNPCGSEDESEEEEVIASNTTSAADDQQRKRAAAAAREQKEQEKEAEARARAEAVQRRAERLAEREQEKAEKASTGGSKNKDLDAVLEKVSRVGVGKLSNKERRLYTRHMEKQEEEAQELAAKESLARAGPEAETLAESLKDFSVSVAGGNEMQPGAVDLRVEGFSISAGGNRLLDNCSLTLAKGRRYGFLGPNGQGKTTLLRHLAARRLPVPEHWRVHLVEQEAAATETPVVDEVIRADNARHLLLEEEAELLAKLEALESSASDSITAEELEQLCQRLTAVGEELEASGAEAAEASVRRILCGLGFTTEMADGPVNRLSGGWRMRVSLAKALFLQPDLLLLDEPTNHLDLDAVLWLDEYLCSYPKTMFVVTHDADFLDSACTDVVHLEDKQLHQYRGGYTEFKKGHALRVREKEKEYKKQQEEKKSGKKVKHPEELVQKPKDYVVKFHFLPPVREDEMSGISVHDVEFSYSGKKPWLLRDLNFRVDSDTRVTIVGANGSGKSTLLNLISKNIEPSSGEVVHSRRLAMGRYSQHFDEIAPALGLTAVEFLTSHELRRFGAGTESPELAHKCLGQFGLPSHAHGRPMRELSGGQKARVCFASITCRRPEILILDEPTNHLDIESVEALIDALKKYSGGLLLVTHDARLVQATNCDLWVCRGIGEDLGKAASFKEYRKEVLADLAKRQAVAEAEAKRRAAARRKRREETLGRRVRSK